MNLFKFIWGYWTNSIFRKNIALMMYRIEHQEEIEKEFQEEVEKIRKETLTTYKKRIDDLVFIKDYIDGGTPLSKINELINDFKKEYREIEKEAT